jgi:hypothetical protein
MLSNKDFSSPQNVTSEHCSLCTVWHSKYHHTIISATLVRHQTHGCHYPLQPWELHCHSEHISHKTLWPDYKQFLHSPATFLTAAHCRWNTNLFHYLSPFPNKQQTPDTQNCQLYTMPGWHPQSTCFPSSDTSNTFMDFWHYYISFMVFLSTVDVAVLQNRHSLSMQYRCHATKKSGEECVQNILFVQQLSTKNTD